MFLPDDFHPCGRSFPRALFGHCRGARFVPRAPPVRIERRSRLSVSPAGFRVTHVWLGQRGSGDGLGFPPVLGSVSANGARSLSLSIESNQFCRNGEVSAKAWEAFDRTGPRRRDGRFAVPWVRSVRRRTVVCVLDRPKPGLIPRPPVVPSEVFGVGLEGPNTF